MSREAKDLKELLNFSGDCQMTLGNLQRLMLTCGTEVTVGDTTYRIISKRLCPGVYNVKLEPRVKIVIKNRIA